MDEWFVLSNYGQTTFNSEKLAKESIIDEIKNDYILLAKKTGNKHIRFDDRLKHLFDNSNPDKNYVPLWQDISYIFESELADNKHCCGVYFNCYRLIFMNNY